MLPEPIWKPDVLIVRKGDDLYRSIDDGATWDVPAGLSSITTVWQLTMLPDAGQTVLLLAKKPGSGGTNQLALYASTNRGASFTLR